MSSPGTAVVTDGEFVLTASDGSQLFATYPGTGGPDPDKPGFFIGEATATITGGPGRFEGASGTAPFSLYIDAANLTETITFDSYVALTSAGNGVVHPHFATGAGCTTPACQMPGGGSVGLL